MLLWSVVILASAIAVAGILWPLLRPRMVQRERDSTLIYSDQLDEIARETANGRFLQDDAELMRREIGRRLLAAARRSSHEKLIEVAPRRALVPFFILFVLLTAGSVLLYAHWGSPESAAPAPDDPDPAAYQNMSVEDLVGLLTRRLVADPAHADGWRLLGRTLMGLQRYHESAQAYARAVATEADPGADLLGAYGEAATAAEDGTVPPEAIVAFERARAKSPTDPRPQFYLARARAQIGDVDGARAALEALLAETAANAPWRAMVEEEIAKLDPAATQPVVTP